MTYIESVLGDFIKSILTRGIKTLKSPKFFPYTSVLVIIIGFSTITSFTSQILSDSVVISEDFINYILYVELSAAIAFVIVGLFLGRSDTKIQLPLLLGLIISLSYLLYASVLPSTEYFALIVVAIFYIIWIGITTFSTFSLFRDLFGSNIFGTVLFLGKQEDDGRAMFSVVGWILAIVNFSLGYLLLKNSDDSIPFRFTAYIIMIFAFLAVLPLFNIQKKHDVFYSIMNAFYMFSTLKVILLVFRVLTSTAGETSFWDAIFSMFMALYAVQGAAAKGVKIGSKAGEMTLEKQLMDEAEGLGIIATISRIVSDRGMVMIILGILLGYHSMQVQASFGRTNLFVDYDFLAGSEIVILGYEFSILISLFIFVISLLLFLILPKYRSYANPEITRIPWAPDYPDLKLMLAGIKSGDVQWKGDAAKLAMGFAKDKLKEKLGMKKENDQNRLSNTFGKWLGSAKKNK